MMLPTVQPINHVVNVANNIGNVANTGKGNKVANSLPSSNVCWQPPPIAENVVPTQPDIMGNLED
jgi:hypothetical protein